MADTTSSLGAARRDTPDRAPGRRGRATRQRLLDAAAGLLDATSYRDLKVVDIARSAGTSPATFYQYFADVEDAVLALAVEVERAAGAELASLVTDRPWTGPEAWASAVALAEGFLATWDRYRPVLRVIDLATDEGDRRFRAVRTGLLGAPAAAFVTLLERRRGGAPVDTLAEAGVLVSTLAHVAAHHEGLEQWGATPEGLRTSLAQVAHATLTGERPPHEA